MSEPAIVRRLTPVEARNGVGSLAEVLIDCVERGASVSFMAPLARDKAEQFWHGVADGVAAGQRALLVAEEPVTSQVLGTVQLILAQPENQPHRADVSKMLVLGSARRRGIGAALMRAVENEALGEGKTLLVLDTASEEAERLYQRYGWIRVGAIPGFALLPDGRPCDTTFYYRLLAEAPGDFGTEPHSPPLNKQTHASDRAVPLHLIQILLPLFDNQGRSFGPEVYREVRDELSTRFGGLTAFSRAPAEGLWRDEGSTHRDDIVVYEVMADELDASWWHDYRQRLEQTLRQDSIVIRAQEIRLL